MTAAEWLELGSRPGVEALVRGVMMLKAEFWGYSNVTERFWDYKQKLLEQRIPGKYFSPA